jgi:uncharacterized membrane protein YraQ (UPF0718 family)
MKLTNINTILLYISLVLAVAILFSVIFGCFFKKRKIEKFATDSKEAGNDLAAVSKKDDKKKDDKKVSHNADKKKEDSKTESKLSQFETSIVDGLSSGKMSSKDLEKFIQDGKFTKDNLNNMISYIEDKQKNL